MKKGILLFLSLFFAFVMSAQERTENDAASIARSFFNGATKRNTTEKQSELRLVAVSSTLLPTLSTRSSSYPAFYVFNNGENGYVIVSGDERMKTILGYSKNSSFITDSVSSSTLAWLEMYINEMNQLAQIENTFPFAEFDNEVRNYPTAISPLLGNVQWNQGAPYNNKCPQKSVTGCVATAMAMVMNYHQYPGKGKGSKSYKTATLGININYDFSNVTFDWSKMLPEYVSGSYSPEQANAVAELMYACGIAVEMDYNPSGSGAFSQQIPQAMIDYFGYDENATYYTRDCFSYNDWVSMIKEEIAEGRPILYNGTSKEGGHQFIFDGYDESNLVHINWGWGGSNNGYFEISSLEPSNPGIGGGTNLGGGFTYSQGMIVGIQKPTNTSQYQASFTVQHITFDQFPAKKGDEVAPKIVSLYNQGTYIEAGQVSLILEKDGLQREVGIASFSKLSTGYGFPSIDWQAQLGSIPFPDVPDGTYLFYVGVRVPSKDNKWFKALCSMGYDGMYHVVVEGDKVTFLPTWTTPSLAASIVEVYHGLYSGQVADFRVAFANNSNFNEYYVLFSFGLFQNNVLKTTILTSTLFFQPN